MINNCKLIKNGKIYLPAAFQQPHKFQSSEQNSLKSLIRIFIEGILNFGNVSTKDETNAIVEMIISRGIDRSELKLVWNQVLKTQIKKYANRINSLIKVSKQSQLLKIGDSAILKIQVLSQSISKLMIILSSRQKWCLCSQAKCLNRYNGYYTYEAIKKYLISYLKPELHIQKDKFSQYSTNQQQNVNFFNMENDQRCNLISLEKLDNQNSNDQQNSEGQQIYKKQSIDSYLSHLKIDNFERKQCRLDTGWLQKMKAKYRQYKF